LAFVWLTRARQVLCELFGKVPEKRGTPTDPTLVPRLCDGLATAKDTSRNPILKVLLVLVTGARRSALSVSVRADERASDPGFEQAVGMQLSSPQWSRAFMSLMNVLETQTAAQELARKLRLKCARFPCSCWYFRVFADGVGAWLARRCART
jgi:hypothetical protein